MNQLNRSNKKIIAGVAACLLLAGLTMSFQNTPFGPIDKLDMLTDLQDTVPEKPKDRSGEMTINDFDLLIQHMDKEILEMQKEAARIDLDKMHQDINASLSKVDLDKIQRGIDKAMKDIDFAKIEAGVKSALQQIDWDEVNNDVRLSLQDAKKEIDKIDMESLKKEMEKAKLEIEATKNELKKINIDEVIKNANSGIARAKEELRLTKQMFNEMEKEGLINQRQGFTIEYKNKVLYINGRKQSESITNKYKPYIKEDPYKITISKE